MDDLRPAKRPRLTRCLPDGFAPSKPRPISAPVFVSGFDSPTSTSASSLNPPGTTASVSGASVSRPVSVRPRPLTGHAPEFPRPDFGKPATSKAMAKPKPTSTLKLKNLPVWAPIPGPSNRPTNVNVIARPISALRLAPKDEKLARRMIRLSDGPPEMIMPPPKVPSKPLRALPPPPIPQRKAPPSTKLMPITKTPIALATDIHTQSGLTELLSLYLQQHGTGYVDPVERELRRGLEQSPEKKSKTKMAKYVRGGLAEAASRRFAATRNNHQLWELEIDRNFRKGRGTRADVHLRVTSIIHASSPPTNPKSPHTPLLVLARCHTLSSQVVTDIKPNREIMVLFRVSDNPKLDARAKERHVLAEGLDVSIWRPWFKVDVPTCETIGALGYDPALGGSSVWFCQRYFVPIPKSSTSGC